MALIKSVSGMRGTIGGTPGDALTPIDIVEFASAYGRWLCEKTERPQVVIGRDGRITGEHVQSLVMETLLACGIDVIDVGPSTTPTVEMYVTKIEADGGIILTASHNPRHWNALKFLNEKGEFISAADGNRLLEIIRDRDFVYADIDARGRKSEHIDAVAYHVERICALDLVDADAVRSKGFHVVVDCINSTGAIALPVLFEALDCTYTLLNKEVTGEFAHDPEPLPSNLKDLMTAVAEHGADLGIAVDPDVDRLAFVSEDGSYFGEEYTLVAIADYILGRRRGNTVSNLSSSMALRDVTIKHGGEYFASAVGEVHVVNRMKAVNAVIGGEGNGGIILPDLHYGRDALVGIALMLSFMALEDKTASALRSTYPDYTIVKSKVQLTGNEDLEQVLAECRNTFPTASIDTQDGIKVVLENEWVQLRKSNTEPVIRIYAESKDESHANDLVAKVRTIFDNLAG